MIKPTVETRFEIQDLLAAYGWALDTGDFDALAACFTEDGQVIEEVFEDADIWDGREGVKAMAKHYANAPGFPGRQHHVTQSQYTSVSDNLIHLRSFAFVTECHNEPPYLLRFAGYYDDEITKTHGGKWLFSKRAIRLWDGEVLQNLPGCGDWKPRKRPESLMRK